MLGRRGMQDWLAGFDVVWDTRSGDSFTDIYGPRRHAIMASVHEFAVQAGASVMIAPQTIAMTTAAMPNKAIADDSAWRRSDSSCITPSCSCRAPGHRS